MAVRKRRPGDETEKVQPGSVSSPGAMRGKWLLIAVSGSVSVVKLLPASGEVTLGRDEECDIVLDHASISRRHARLRLGTSLEVVDLASMNGTRVGGTSVAPNQAIALAPGALLEIGSVHVVVQRIGDVLPVDLAIAPSPRASAFVSDHRLVCDGAVAHLLEIVDRVASDRLTVLLLGETGVGKDVFAEMIHARSSRAKGPFIRLHCSAMSESLLESELFGHERGAFTGAHAAKPGLLELADHGTAFIDEVGELSPAAQVKLLRVLEDRRVTRLGATKPVKVDVRFVAATNRDLEADVERGTFRRDLYYRLAGLVLVIPPLRERRDEIPALARSFLRVAAEERRMGVPDIDPRAMQALVEHAWGGNVRELRNVMGRALLLSRGETLLWEHLLLGGRVEAPAIRGTAAPVEAGGEKSDEARRIVEALATCGGNQGEAAKLLGMSRRTLIHRIELYDLPRPRKGRS